MADKLHAMSYIECSAKTQENLKAVFDTVINLGLKSKYNKKKDDKCIII